MASLMRPIVLAILLLTSAVVPAVAQQPEQQNEYVPIDQLPPQDQLPAAPLLVTAYSVVMAGLFAYVLSVARRLTTVQHELERLESDLKKTRRT